MTVLLILITLLGFLLCYSTSKKVTLNHDFFLNKIAQGNPGPSKLVGLLLLLTSLVGSILFWGVGAGIFAFFVILMTVGSTVVLIAPLRYLNYKWVTGLFLFFLIAEIIFY